MISKGEFKYAPRATVRICPGTTVNTVGSGDAEAVAVEDVFREVPKELLV